MIKDTLTQVSALCVGATAMALGDPTAWAAMATAAGGLAAVVLGRRAELAGECDRVFARVQKAHARDWERVPLAPAERDAVDRVDALIREAARDCLLDKAALAESAFDRDKFPAKATALMLDRLGIHELKGHPEVARRYAAGLITAGLEAAMESQAFYRGFRLQLSLEQARQIGLVRDEVRAVSAGMEAGFAAILAKLDTGTRDELLAAARAFGLAEAEPTLARLREFLADKAADYRRLETQIASFGEADGRVGNLLASGRAALDAGRFDEVRALIADARAVQRAERTLPALRREAELYGIEAESFLLQGEVDLAVEAFEASATLFSGVDRREQASTRHAAAGSLCQHSLRFGGQGLQRAIELYRRNETIWTRVEHAWDWARTQNNLGAALADEAGRTPGVALLAEAVAAYRAALKVRTRAEHPVDWAMTQNNLGNALGDQAGRTEGAAAVALLAEAVAAYRAALEVSTRAEHPVAWAMTQNNLGGTLSGQAARTEGAAGVALLTQTVAAYRAALEVRTRAEHPVDWAISQNNLGATLDDKAGRTEGAAGVALLAESVAAYRSALEVFTRADHPVDWAMTQSNLGNALRGQAERTEGAAGVALLAEAVVAGRAALEGRTRAEHPVGWAMSQNNLAATLADQAGRTDGAAGVALLAEAVVVYRAALEVRMRAAHPVDWAETQENLGEAYEAMGDRGGDDAAARYREARDAFDAALEVFDPANMAPNHAKCATNRARVAAKLAGLG